MVISPPFGRARGISPDVSARIARSRVVATSRVAGSSGVHGRGARPSSIFPQAFGVVKMIRNHQPRRDQDYAAIWTYVVAS